MKLGVASHRSIAPVWETVPIGRAAIRALYAELALHPGPASPSPLGSGSHDDMDMTTFMRSLFALRGYTATSPPPGRAAPTSPRCKPWASPPSGACSHRRRQHPPRRGVRAWPADRRRRLAARTGKPLGGQALGGVVATLWGDDILAASPRAPDSNGAGHPPLRRPWRTARGGGGLSDAGQGGCRPWRGRSTFLAVRSGQWSRRSSR